MSANYCFPARIVPNGIGGFKASFRDVPEALTEAETMDEVVDMARDALITAIDFYIETARKFPDPSSPENGEVMIELPPSVIAKVLLLNQMVASHVRQADLAKKMGVPRQEVSRITDLHHATKIDTIARALYALGKRLTLSVN